MFRYLINVYFFAVTLYLLTLHLSFCFRAHSLFLCKYPLPCRFIVVTFVSGKKLSNWKRLIEKKSFKSS